MLWFPLTLLSAMTLSVADALTKRAVDGPGVFMTTWLRGMAALPVLFVAAMFVTVPSLDRTFYYAVAAALPLEIAASLMYIRAIQVSPLSLTIPFLALTPAYAMFFSYVMLGETPSPVGGLGVALICIGAYMLNMHTIRGGGLFAPFRAVAREPGSMMMMAVAAIYALTSNLGKLAILHSSPVFFAASYWTLYCVLLAPAVFLVDRRALPTGRQARPLLAAFVPIGLAQGAMILSHMYAISLTQVSYMVAVKRTSLLFAIGFGYFMFGEKNISERLAGSAVMIAGLALIVSQ